MRRRKKQAAPLSPKPALHRFLDGDLDPEAYVREVRREAEAGVRREVAKKERALTRYWPTPRRAD